MKKRLEAISSRTGKIKVFELEVKDNKVISRWGYKDGKMQETEKICEVKNVGKSNERSAKEQAIEVFKRKVEEKKRKGYKDPQEIKKIKKNGEEETPNFKNLQPYFAPYKPSRDYPKDIFSGDYIADKKYNGVNLIFCKNKKGGHIYTRRIKEITENLRQFSIFNNILSKMSYDSMICVELVYETKGREVPKYLRGLIHSESKKEDVRKHYEEITKNGSLKVFVFDILFWKGKFLGDRKFKWRRVFIKKKGFNVPKMFLNLKKEDVEKAKKKGWEGFIIRRPNSKFGYTMDGKAYRSGAWKYKFELEDDFIVTAAEYGQGKHSDYFARFRLAQYKNGDMIDCGWCGPGEMTEEELKDLYEERSDKEGNYIVKPFMVIEVRFRARQYDSSKLEFPVFVRIRDDKRPSECVYSGG